MCGIFAYSNSKYTKNAGEIILEGLTILQNRGYDSVGITTISNNNYITTKSSSEEDTCDGIIKLSQSISKHSGADIGIGHTRWATHGAKTVRNCHSHFDVSKRFCVVHNGVIENYMQIKNFLQEKNIHCVSETDTEVIVQLLYYYSTLYEFSKALKETLSHLEGTWALAILDLENLDTIVATRRGSPLLIGVGINEHFISSEVSAFARYTTKYINLNNDEIIFIKNNNINLEERIQISQNTDTILLSPAPFTHWTLREIKEQETSIIKAMNNGGRIKNGHSVNLGGLESNKQELLQIKNLIIIGCGTSKHAGDFAAFLFRKISGFDTVTVIDASEFNLDFCNSPNVGILALSQSGETQDVLRCLKDFTKTSFSVVNKVDSLIAKTTKCGVYLNAGREVAVASTKSFTSTVCVLSLVAIWFAQNRNLHKNIREDTISYLNKLPLCFKYSLNDHELDAQCDKVAEYLKTADKLFILGKETSVSIAYEAALKIKEIIYLHAEGYPGGSLKHGPFALIEKGTPIMIILLNNQSRSYMESTINEVKSRGAFVITFTDIIDHDFSDIVIQLPQCDIYTSLLAIIPLQLIAYKLSCMKNINPDKPRNLAKVVTVI